MGTAQTGNCPTSRREEKRTKRALDRCGNNSSRHPKTRKNRRGRTNRLRRVFRTMGTTKSEHLCGIGLTEGTPTIVCSKMQPVSKRSGVYFCHSRACPGCVHYENAKLVNRIVPSLKAALVDGRWVLFGTLTLKHHRRTDPGELLEGLTKCWNAVNLKLKKTYEGFEYFWSRDFTWSERNGCHFHLHFLLVLDGGGPWHS